MSYFKNSEKAKDFNRENEVLLLKEIFQKEISITDNFIVYDENKSGGIGFIGLCKNKIDKKFYVLKTYKYDNYINMFKEEIEFALKLEKHPHIVYSQTALKEKGRVYLVMELVGKQPKNEKEEWKAATLTQGLQKGISIEESYKWAIEFCRGMQYLNSIGMKSHQDIKPDNILITEDRHIKISDFGFATLKGGKDKKGGSEYYYSPEHYIEDKELDIRSDIYSFGIVLYEMFNAGTNLYPKTRIGKLKRKNNSIEISKIKSKHCNEIIKKCLQPKQEDRYQTFKELEKDLLKEAKKEIDKDFKVKELPMEQMEAKDYYYKGNGYCNIEKYLEGISFYDKTIKLDPKNAYAFVNRGNAKFYQIGYVYYIRDNIKSQYEEVLKDYDKAINIYSSFTYAYNRRARIKIYLKQYEEAIKDYNMAIKLDPKNADAYCERGDAKAELKQYEEAIKDYDKAIELDSKEYFFYKRAEVLKQTGYYKEALEDYTKAIKLDPEDFRKYMLRAEIFEKMEKNEEAIKDYNNAIKIIPKNNKWDIYDLSIIYDCRLVLLLRLGKIKEALKYYNIEIDLNKNDYWIYHERAKFLERIGHYQEALEDYNKAIELMSNNYVYLKRAEFLERIGKNKEALKDYNKAIKLDTKDCFLYLYRAKFLERIGKNEEALKDYNKAIEIRSNYFFVYVAKAHFLEKREEYEEAIKDWKKVIELNSNFTNAYNSLIKIYKLLGREKEAKEVEEKLKGIVKEV